MIESDFVDMVWKALLNQCASDPKQAVRLVMVQKEDVNKAMSVVFRELPISNKGDGVLAESIYKCVEECRNKQADSFEDTLDNWRDSSAA